jgi:hypothetical protein
MLRKLIIAASLLISFALPLYAQSQNPQQDSPKAKKEENQKKESYESLLERVKKEDETVDFTALRMAFAETKNFDPYGGREERDAMFAARNEKDFKKALKLAEERLSKNYVDLNAHFIAFVANRELKNDKRTEFHRNIFLKLIESIKSGGDGKTPETAYTVISVEEEYVLLSYLGYNVKGQALIKKDGHSYDKMSVVNSETKETAEFYFQIDKVFGYMEKLIKNQ